ncbi:hypothetical protein, partial [Pantoea sp. GbtcB22]|uniref:hypothetical protein n=1 Tax=Pantoea sp. GbtcB22 TaxID=2824767 RepID=UPI001C309196
RLGIYLSYRRWKLPLKAYLSIFHKSSMPLADRINETVLIMRLFVLVRSLSGLTGLDWNIGDYLLG